MAWKRPYMALSLILTCEVTPPERPGGSCDRSCGLVFSQQPVWDVCVSIVFLEGERGLVSYGLKTSASFTCQLWTSSRPVGSWFLTRLSVCRANTSDRWETDLIMFSFFSNFHSLERFVLSSFKPQRYISLQTQTSFFSFFVCVFAFSGSPRWPEQSSPTEAFCDISSPPKNAVVCLSAEPKSAVLPLGDRPIRNTEDALLHLFSGCDSDLSSFGRNLKRKQWLLSSSQPWL